MKKFISLCLVMLMSLTCLTGCGAKTEAPAGKNEQVYKITLAAAVSTTTAMYKAAEIFKSNVEEKTGKKVIVDLVFGGVLGGDREMVDALTVGDIQMAFATDIGYATCYPEIGYVNLPYLFPDYASVDKYYFNGFLGQKLKSQLQARGIRLLGWAENDYRSLTSNKAIKTIKDLKGLKIRTPEFPSLMAFFKELGANPTPMAFTELLTGLQQGTVDGQDNGPILTASSKFYEVQTHFTWTNHVYSGGGLGINEKFYQSLPKEYQAIIAEEGAIAGSNQIKWNRENVATCIKTMEAYGTKISELTPEMQEIFKTAATKVWEQFKDKYDAEAMDYIFKNLGK